MSKILGQNFRLISAQYPLPEETNCSVNMTGNTESSSTKDTEGMYAQDVVVSTSWSAQVDTQQSNTAALQELIGLFAAANKLPIGWDQTEGANNRTKVNATFKRSGMALLNDFTMNFNDREVVTISLQFQGTGALTA